MFAGVFYRQPLTSQVSADDLSGPINDFNQADKVGHYQDERMTLVQCTVWNSKYTKLDPSPYHDQHANIVICGWVRLDNRDELVEALGLSGELRCDSELIVNAYLKWGKSCVDHLIGDFSFVLYDINQNHCFCARDHLGVRPFYYYIDDTVFVFSTHINTFKVLPFISIEIEKDWVVKNYLGCSASSGTTPYQSIYKLKPSHCMQVTPRSINQSQYFEFDTEIKYRYASQQEYVEHYQSILNDAITSRLDSEYDIGCEMSGGLDSSSIASIAKPYLESQGKNIYTYGHHKLELDQKCIESVVDYLGLEHHMATDNFDHFTYRRIAQSVKILGMPDEHGMASFHVPFYEDMRAGNRRTLLSGFGGDECVTSSGSRYITECLHQHRYREAWRLMTSKWYKKPASFVLQMFRCMFKQRSATHIEIERRKRNQLKYMAIKPECLNSDILDLYLNGGDKILNGSSATQQILDRCYSDYMPTRLETCSLLGNAYKIDYCWPLLDVRLIQFFLSIPPELKYNAKRSRYFHRLAMEGKLPKFIQWREKGTGGFVDKPALYNAEEVESMLSGLINRDLETYVDKEKIATYHQELNGEMDVEQEVVRFKSKNFPRFYELNAWLNRDEVIRKEKASVSVEELA